MLANSQGPLSKLKKELEVSRKICFNGIIYPIKNSNKRLQIITKIPYIKKNKANLSLNTVTYPLKNCQMILL